MPELRQRETGTTEEKTDRQTEAIDQPERDGCVLKMSPALEALMELCRYPGKGEMKGGVMLEPLSIKSAATLVYCGLGNRPSVNH